MTLMQTTIAIGILAFVVFGALRLIYDRLEARDAQKNRLGGAR